MNMFSENDEYFKLKTNFCSWGKTGLTILRKAVQYSSDVCFEGFQEKVKIGLGDNVIEWLFKGTVA
jgi:hypothetical protein